MAPFVSLSPSLRLCACLHPFIFIPFPQESVIYSLHPASLSRIQSLSHSHRYIHFYITIQCHIYGSALRQTPSKPTLSHQTEHKEKGSGRTNCCHPSPD